MRCSDGGTGLTPGAAAAFLARKARHRLRKHGNNNGLVLRDGHAAYILVEHVDKPTDN